MEREWTPYKAVSFLLADRPLIVRTLHHEGGIMSDLDMSGMLDVPG